MTAPVDKGINGASKATKATANATGLNKKISGVPIWGWIVLVFGVGGGVYYMRRSSGVSKARSEAASATTEMGAGYTTEGYMAPTTVSSDTRILTNSQWSQAAQAVLIQKGHQPTVVAAAVQNYIANKMLDPNQQSLIDEAIKALGPLPQMSSGASSTLSRLKLADDGNLFGAAVGAIGNAIGMNDPDNKAAPYFAPFFNNLIEHGPISGAFQNSNDLLGGSTDLNLNPQIEIPGVGKIGLNLGANNNVITGGGTLPQIAIPGPNGQPLFSIGGGGNASVAPNSRDTFLGSWTVNEGDTLEQISQEVYGGTGGAALIYTANLTKITDMNNLKPGTVLKIPVYGR